MSGQTPPIAGIILTGFMGAGKTTAGALLAVRLGWRFVDSDRVVEERAGMNIAAIFERRGEPEFRRLEAEVIRETTQDEHIVLALGGGALESATTREFLASLPGWHMVFLDAPLETLIGRCAGQPDAPVRPVLRDRERLAERWKTRLPGYAQAKLTVGTADRAPEAVAAAIVAAFFGDPAGEPVGAPVQAHSAPGARA
ncbi:MAG TPA: shikimate kinase [Acidobacteriaceae bacterium]